MHLTLPLSSAHVKFDVWTGPKYYESGDQNTECKSKDGFLCRLRLRLPSHVTSASFFSTWIQIFCFTQIKKHTRKTEHYPILGWNFQQWWLFLHSVVWWCSTAPLLGEIVHSTAIVEKGRFVHGKLILLQPFYFLFCREIMRSLI